MQWAMLEDIGALIKSYTYSQCVWSHKDKYIVYIIMIIISISHLNIPSCH